MADTIQYSMSGLDELLGKLDGLAQDMKFKGGRFALRKAAQVLQRQAMENARRVDDPATPESIEKNIAVRWSGRRFKRTGDLMFRVGVLGGARSTSRSAVKSERRRRRAGVKSLKELGEIEGAGKRNPGGDTWYWRLLEFGFTARDGKLVAAQPFIRPVPDQAGQAAVDEFVGQYGRALDRAVKRAAKRAAPG